MTESSYVPNPTYGDAPCVFHVSSDMALTSGGARVGFIVECELWATATTAPYHLQRLCTILGTVMLCIHVHRVYTISFRGKVPRVVNECARSPTLKRGRSEVCS